MYLYIYDLVKYNKSINYAITYKLSSVAPLLISFTAALTLILTI